MEIQSVLAEVARLQTMRDRVVVGISGFGGAGKSTLQRLLVNAIDGSVALPGDDFLEPDATCRRSSDWSGVDRMRLRDEVLLPFHRGEEVMWRRYDWEAGGLGPSRVLPPGSVLLVDLIGLFHPEILDYLDMTVWVDSEFGVATARGKKRDRALGNDHDQLWEDVWRPNELDFAARFEPRTRASHIVKNEPVERHEHL